MFKKKTSPTLEERVAASTQDVNQKTAAAYDARVALADAVHSHYELGDEINAHIEETRRAAELRIQSLTELQQNAYLHADDTVSTHL